MKGGSSVVVGAERSTRPACRPRLALQSAHHSTTYSANFRGCIHHCPKEREREREPSPPPQRRLCDWAVYYYTLTGQHRCCYWNLLCSEAFFLEYPPITTTINVLRIIHYEAEVHGLDYSDCHDEHDLPIACMIPPHISSLRHGESRQIRSLRQHSHSFI
jgi:hypothetical protein